MADTVPSPKPASGKWPARRVADASVTLRAYAANLANFEAWCVKHGFQATPEIVGAYLAAAGEGYALPTLRRRVAAIARACSVAGHPLDTKHPAIRETLRGIGRKHGTPSRRTAARTTAEIRKLSRRAAPRSPARATGHCSCRTPDNHRLHRVGARPLVGGHRRPCTALVSTSECALL